MLRDVALKRELAIWLDAKLTDIEKRHNLDAKNAALLRAMAIKRLTKYKKGKKVWLKTSCFVLTYFLKALKTDNLSRVMLFLG